MKYNLAVKKATEALFQELEGRELISRLSAPNGIYQEDAAADGLEVLYTTDQQYGSHKMIVVQKNQTEITDLFYHPDKEEVIALDRLSKSFKPLYLIIALYKAEEFESRAEAGELTQDDVLAIEIPFNDSRFSYFTMLENTVHCEVTARGPGMGPVFFVTEPTDLLQHTVRRFAYSYDIVR